MKSALRVSIVPALFASALFAPAPAAAIGPAERAVAMCRAEMLSHFDAGAIRSHRIGTISGPARRTRVTIFVNADRRYRFDCATDGEGRILTASFDPARGAGPRLAGGDR